MSDLASREIQPPRGPDAAALTADQVQELLNELGGGWEWVNSQRLEKEFRFPDFRTALEFSNQVGELAESADHHPEICLSWGKARVSISTHSVGGLSEADFVFAAKCDTFTGS
jgi:4a-hydroxytetrahydrobiopterin dehydratase